MSHHSSKRINARPAGSRTILRAGSENLTEKQRARLTAAINASPAHEGGLYRLPVHPTAALGLPHTATHRGRRITKNIADTFATCPIPEIARQGRMLQRWREAFLAYFTTDRSNNGGTEAVSELIKLHRRVARRFRNRDNYRLRTLLVGGGLSHSHLK